MCFSFLFVIRQNILVFEIHWPRVVYCRVFQDTPEIFIMLCPTKNVILRSPLFMKHSLYFISC